MKKKNLMFVCACLLMSHAVSAQSKGEEIQFHRHGSLQLQGGAAYTLGEAGFGYWYLRLWGCMAVTILPRCGDCVPVCPVMNPKECG